MRNRACTNPPAQNGGKTCLDQGLGPEIETQMCNVQPCPSEWHTNIQQKIVVGLLSLT